MSATDILFDPIIKPTPITPDAGIVRTAEALSVEIRHYCPRSGYMRAAGEVMDAVVVGQRHIPDLIDVRQETQIPRGVLHLTGLVSRFFDGSEEIWVACPKHMPPDRMRFRGRFGFMKISQLPMNHGSFENHYWSWVETNAGFLHAIDLGLIMIPAGKRWYRVFTNKSEANSYYTS
jgi:hypothetical protein